MKSVANSALHISELSKLYRIRPGEGNCYRSLREEIMHAVSWPLRAIRGERQRPWVDVWALKDVNFDVQPGEVVGVVGRNGAGKSTLLKILSRVTKPTRGYAELRGRVGSLLEVGTGFHPELTGRENIFLSGAVLGMKRAEIARKFDEIVAFAEVEKFLDTPVKRYSSGMFVRLAFSVAIHLNPDILIVDEVLAVGDAAFQKKCFGKVRDAADAGRTVLFVSHNLAAVNQFCTRAIWLEQGQLRADGEPGEVTRKYLSDNELLVAQRQWNDPQTAPGDDHVRLNGVRLTQGNQTTPVIDINQSFAIEVDFEALQPVQSLVAGVSLFHSDTSCILAAVDWQPTTLPPGRYRKTAHFPAPLLAEGRISVLVRLFSYEPDVTYVNQRDLLMFDAVDSDSPLSVRGPIKGDWPGQVRIPLEWSRFEKLGE